MCSKETERIFNYKVNFIDKSYKNPRHIYKVTVYIEDNTFSKYVEVKAYYKINKYKGSENCYYWSDIDKLRLKSSYEVFTIEGLTESIKILQNAINKGI